MTKKDFLCILVIGFAVGLLAQPIIGNLVSHLSLALRFAVFFGFLVLAPLLLFIAYLIGKFIPVIYQFAKFAAVGTLNTFIDFGVLNLEIFLFSASSGILYSVFKGISFLAATTNSLNDITEVAGLVRKFLATKGLNKIKFLYGGSVSDSNVGEFLKSKEIDGVLVGSSSVDAKEFKKILNVVLKLK